MHRLIRAPEWIGKTLGLEISANKQAVSNLERILDHGNKANQELQMRAIEIMTELAFDSSTNLSTGTKENIIKKQLHLLLTDDEGAEEKLKSYGWESTGISIQDRTTIHNRNYVHVYNEQI